MVILGTLICVGIVGICRYGFYIIGFLAALPIALLPPATKHIIGYDESDDKRVYDVRAAYIEPFPNEPCRHRNGQHMVKWFFLWGHAELKPLLSLVAWKNDWNIEKAKEWKVTEKIWKGKAMIVVFFQVSLRKSNSGRRRRTGDDISMVTRLIKPSHCVGKKTIFSLALVCYIYTRQPYVF